MAKVTLKVPDMSCGHCVAAIRGALEKLEGVEGVDASLETKIVTVTTRGDLTGSQLAGAVRDVGYSPEVTP